MSILTGYICDECGVQTRTPEKWLVLSKIDIHRLLGDGSVVSVKSKLDFCSPGCLLRWLSRAVNEVPKVQPHL
ncbi:MAG TPA: hypothetical protein PLP86_06020, partial [Armatimonadota bacterium]|nr:hypothetical protein [Armatimonadota bacterium]